MLRYRILLLLVSLGIASAALASGSGPVLSLHSGAIVALAAIVGVLALARRPDSSLASPGVEVALQPQIPSAVPSKFTRENYLRALNRFATVMGGIRAFTYVPTVLTLVASANSDQHSLWTWGSWILANASMTLVLFEKSNRKMDSFTWMQMANTLMCLATTIVIVWYRF